MKAKNLFSGLVCLAVSGTLLAASDLQRAQDLYNHTEYEASLKVLSALAQPDAATYSLIGQDYLMLGDYKKAAEVFRKAVDLEPNNSDYNLWLGRAYARRAETATPLLAAPNAAKARQYFETAVKLDPRNKEALDDLFDYYLEAPGFLGGGFDKASDIASKIATVDPAEGHFAQAQLAQKKKQYSTEEEQLRRSVELAPRKVGRAIELARFLADQGRYAESDSVFAQAEQVAPNSPKLMFAKAKTLMDHHRKLDEANELLRRFVQSQLTPNDPPRADAEKLLKVARGA